MSVQPIGQFEGGVAYSVEALRVSFAPTMTLEEFIAEHIRFEDDPIRRGGDMRLLASPCCGGLAVAGEAIVQLVRGGPDYTEEEFDLVETLSDLEYKDDEEAVEAARAKLEAYRAGVDVG